MQTLHVAKAAKALHATSQQLPEACEQSPSPLFAVSDGVDDNAVLLADRALPHHLCRLRLAGDSR